MAERSMPERVRFFTMARRFPRLVGRFHDGTPIWGGPYTTTQLGIGGAVAALMWYTKDFWGTGMVLVDVVIIVPVAVIAVLLGGLIPIGARNPVILLSGIFRSVVAGGPRYNGRPLPKPTSVRIRGIGAPQKRLQEARRPDRSTEPDRAETAPEPQPRPSVQLPAAPGPATGLERLLARTGTSKD